MSMGRQVEYTLKYGLVGFWALCGSTGLASPAPAAEASQDAAPELLVPTPAPVGLLQVWATAWDQDEEPSTDPASYGDPEDDPGFKLRRARVGLEGDGDHFRYAILFGVASPFDQVGGGDGSVELVDASGATRVVQDVWVSLGLQKVPVSREMLMSAGDLALGERSVATEWMAPGRDVGLLVDASTDTSGGLKLRARSGVFNGNNDPLGDDDPGMLIALRLDGSMGEANLDQSYGSSEGLSVGLGLDGWYDQSFSTRSLGGGGDIALRLGNLSGLVEARWGRIEPLSGGGVEVPDVWSQTNRIGGLIQVGYTHGSFEPVVRASYFDDSLSAEDNGDVADAMGGLTWHGKGDTTRIGAGYVKRLERSGANASNDTVRIWLQTRL